MDLTYMPGELDLKNTKNVNGSGMKREHDSVDDFEHVDPESSPVDTQLKDFSTLEKFDKIDDLLEKSSLVDHDGSDLSNKGLGHSTPVTSESNKNDDFSGFDRRAESQGNIASDKQNQNLLYVAISDTGDLISPIESSFKEDPLNIAAFISAEITSNSAKTESDGESLNLDNKTKDDARDNQELPSVNILDKHIKDEDDQNKHIKDEDYKNSEFTKSMKEAEALPQYEIKYEKKETEEKDDQLISEKHNSESLFDLDKHDAQSIPVNPLEPEPLAKVEPAFKKPEPEIKKPEPEILKIEPEDKEYEPKSKKAELDQSKPEANYSTLKEDEFKTDLLKEQTNSDEETKPATFEVPSKPLIPIKPAAATSETVKNLKKSSISDLDDIIGPEDVFKRIGLDAWFTPERLHPKVEALVYWRDPKKSGVVFGGIMAILLSLCYMSLISVIAYSSLLVLTGTICFRIYKSILQAVQKTNDGHPFKDILELELSLPQDKVREVVDTAVDNINAYIVELRRLFLVEDLIDSIKFGVCLWCLTYVGAIFNGMTLVILAFVALFTVPKIYENNKASIDTYIDMGRSKVAEITSKVKAAVPIGKKEAEKEKDQ